MCYLGTQSSGENERSEKNPRVTLPEFVMIYFYLYLINCSLDDVLVLYVSVQVVTDTISVESMMQIRRGEGDSA